MTYPTEDQLVRIETWEIKPTNMKDKDSLDNLLKYVDALWNYQDISLKGNKFSLHTSGWSGNEDIIEALKKNRFFWMFFWERSDRGGHYYFVVPEHIPDDKDSTLSEPDISEEEKREREKKQKEFKLKEEFADKLEKTLGNWIDDDARFYQFFTDLYTTLEKGVHHNCDCVDCSTRKFYAKVFRKMVEDD